jgi:hypothetical protein
MMPCQSSRPHQKGSTCAASNWRPSPPASPRRQSTIDGRKSLPKRFVELLHRFFKSRNLLFSVVLCVFLPDYQKMLLPLQCRSGQPVH